MRKLRFSLVVLAAVLLALGGTAAYADQISFGGATGTWVLLNNGDGSITLQGPPTGFSSANTGTFESPNGNAVLTGQPWSLIPTAPFTMSNYNGTNFTTITGSAIPFSFGSGANQLGGNATITLVKDNTTAPQFLASLNVTSSSGLLATLWPVGQNVSMDWTLSVPTTFATLLKSDEGATVSASMSSGEVLPVPEPGTVFLLGAGLLLVGRFLRRKQQIV